jgi:hypothetical protein
MGYCQPELELSKVEQHYIFLKADIEKFKIVFCFSLASFRFLKLKLGFNKVHLFVLN